jgi:hypothetical protein
VPISWFTSDSPLTCWLAKCFIAAVFMEAGVAESILGSAYHQDSAGRRSSSKSLAFPEQLVSRSPCAPQPVVL